MSVLQALGLVALLGGVWGARLSKRRTNSACGVKGANGSSISIVNGDDASECEWKWQVGLTHGFTGMPFCGGMLISPEWALTAAHCASVPNFWVKSGDYKPNEVSGKEQIQKAVQVIQHPDYQEDPPRWDFALVRLEAAMDFGDCVGAVCLPEDGDVEPGTSCWISGWGTLSSGGDQPGTLQEAEVDIISNQDCVGKFQYNSNDIDNSMICAQGITADGKIRDACQGDSGGPLVCQTSGVWTLYGATSWGYGCAGKTYPGIWARVFAAMGWINGVLDADTGPPTKPPVASCPSWSRYPFADSYGDCGCPWGQFCSVDGSVANCPSSGGIGAYNGIYFSPGCDACVCYNH